MRRKTILYRDELNDELSGIKRKTIKIDEDYKYIRKSAVWNIFAFIIYRVIMISFAFIYIKLKFQHKVKNKKVLKSAKGSGYFMYGNHALIAGDAFIPNIINFPRKTFMVVHPDNISVKITKLFVEMCGALPVPNTNSAFKNFFQAIENCIDNKCVVQIYPEAHIWPYYTKIRPFKSTSFRYPIKYDVPTYCITNTFHKKRFSRVPKIVTYVDGPFYADKSLPIKEQEKNLRDIIFETMSKRSEYNSYEYFNYIKEE